VGLGTPEYPSPYHDPVAKTKQTSLEYCKAHTCSVLWKSFTRNTFASSADLKYSRRMKKMWY